MQQKKSGLQGLMCGRILSIKLMKKQTPKWVKNSTTHNPSKPPLFGLICHTLTLAIFERLGGRIGSVLLVFLVAKIRTKVSLVVLKKKLSNQLTIHRVCDLVLVSYGCLHEFCFVFRCLHALTSAIGTLQWYQTVYMCVQ